MKDITGILPPEGEEMFITAGGNKVMPPIPLQEEWEKGHTLEEVRLFRTLGIFPPPPSTYSVEPQFKIDQPLTPTMMREAVDNLSSYVKRSAVCRMRDNLPPVMWADVMAMACGLAALRAFMTTGELNIVGDGT